MTQVVKLLKEHKVYYSSAHNGTTPLHLACKTNNVDIVKYFVEELQIDPNEPKDPKTKKINPLSISMARGHYELSLYLASKGAQVVAEMFYLACKNGNIKLLEFVIDSLKNQGYN